MPNTSDRMPLVTVWSMFNSTIVPNFEELSQTKWNSLLMQSILYSTVHPTSAAYLNSATLQEEMDNIVMGSMHGDLWISRLSLFC